MATEKKWEDLTASEVNLGLIYMHAAGVVCGIAMNFAHQFPMQFPELFLETLMNPPVDSSTLTHNNTLADIKNTASPSFKSSAVMKVYALTFRRGIISIFPEVAFNLFTSDEILRVFNRVVDVSDYNCDRSDDGIDDDKNMHMNPVGETEESGNHDIGEDDASDKS